jgi:hypothetical protein
MARSKEQEYQAHAARCDERGHHVDGCFYCGGNHPSDCCAPSERDEFWSDSPEMDRSEDRRAEVMGW